MTKSLPPNYGWIIDTSWIEEGFSEQPKTVEVAGPGGLRDDILEKLKAKAANTKLDNGVVEFQLYDDDGILYYHGFVFVEESGYDGDDIFGPLEDYGTPNAGCTEMRIWNGHYFEAL